MDQPLSGRKILVTRAKSQAQQFAFQLKEAGAIPVIAPVLSIKSRSTIENKGILQRLHEFTWLFFTSANGVKFFFKQLESEKISMARIHSLHVAAIGKKTATMLQSYGVNPNFFPSIFEGKKMIKEFLQHYPNPKRILLVCGNIARDEIPNELACRNVAYQRIIVYETIINEASKQTLRQVINQDVCDAFTFTSPSSIESFELLTNGLKENLSKIKEAKLCVCIGTTTEQKALEKGFKQVRVPSQFTTEGMIEELIHYFK
ncbi:uroporphyrinogen-III synthase [Aquibacillus salsiterrae]|uniref:Uroporphyrinogen-III synthase n=1 Tax=Aquibacillus salsiterrae TaxID=2950439 RepID=A0A9X3WDY6_9BACI|nr:uroporphyrinogen-III synthase [Aquibacillus salsiterrae]MDC3415684.1 uroporphyrinogen-III synthase [Aquibacillus salsiterrae]